MVRKQRAKYFILIYLFVGSLGAILLIFAFERHADTLQSALISLGTGLLGSVFTFFFISYLFSLDDMELGDRVEKLLIQLENEDHVTAKRFFKNPSTDFTGFIQSSTQIDLCGAALGTTVDTNLGALKAALKKGAKVRILVMSKEDEVLNMSRARSEEDDISYFVKKLDITLQNAEYLKKYSLSTLNLKDDAFNIRLLKYPPSYGILDFNGKESGSIFVELYVHHVDWGILPAFSIDQKMDPDWYSYFQHQFDAMWSRALPYEHKKNTE